MPTRRAISDETTNRAPVDETADAGFEVGVQGTLPLNQPAAWKLVTSPAGRKVWLGEAEAETRTARSGERLRLAYQTRGRTSPTTLQLTLSCPRNTSDRTTIHFHHEKLSGTVEREAMRRHWRQVIEELCALAEEFR